MCPTVKQLASASVAKHLGRVWGYSTIVEDLNIPDA